MTDTTWINQPRWHSLKHVDADFVERFQSKPAIQPKPRYENVRFQILRFAGRQAAAAVRIACSKSETGLASVAEQAMLYEPFTYWDWQGYDAAGKSLKRNYEQEPKDLEGGRRKKRLLWEKERAFRVNGEWDEYPTPRERFEGFKRAVDKRPENKRFVKRFAVANWMTAEDLKWISRNLPQLKALDLSDVPQFHHADAGTWLRTLRFLSTTTPYMLETFHDHFTCLDEVPDEKSLEGDGFLKFVKNAKNYGYRRHRSGEKRRPHELYIKYKKAKSQKESESFEEFFFRLCERQERYEESKDSELSDKLKEAKVKITETHMWRRLKWLGLKDWRADSRPARLVPSCIPGWAVSLETVSIRGEYTRDRNSAEIPSVHHHVCRLMIGIEKFLPESVTSLELRLSVPFLRYLLELLEKRKPSIKRVGIDLGAWVQIYPLRSKQGHLNDEDIRKVTRRVAHSETTCNLFRRGYKTIESYREDRLHGDNIEDYANEQEYIKQQPNFYRDRSGDVDPKIPLPLTEEGASPQKRRDDDEEEVYSYLNDMIDKDIGDIHRNVHNCPIDTSEKHTHTIEELNKTRADTLPKLLEELYLARHATGKPKSVENVSFRVDAKGKRVPKFQIERQGAQIFALDGEKEHRSYDPINPLTLIQVDSLAGVKAGSDYDAWSPNMLGTVYRWVERTFQWRPVFDWDWFMVPGNMGATADPDLVNVAGSEDWGISTPPSGGPGTRGKALQAALRSIKRQFELLNDAGVPVHILIGRRDPDMSSCYWGWPYTAGSWENWVEQSFSANLEGIAEHVNILSILYDLRNPLDDDRLALIESRRPLYPPEGKCPTRVCPFKAGHDEPCPFVRKYPALRNYHPRPQIKGLRKPPKLTTKPGLNFPKPVYGGLASGDTSAPPTGEHADDHSKYDDSEAESREQWPLHLARRSVYARESVGWHRFWTAYAASFSRLTTLRVRMPHSMDKVGSWHLARLINRRNGWQLIDYTSERQHIQTEEDLFRNLASQPESTPSSVYLHKKESRIWPAGRFVRRSWVWDPLELTDDRHIILTKRRESYDTDIDGDDLDEIPIGKKYTAYTFAPRAKLGFTYEDPDLTAADMETLNSSLRDVNTAIAAEIEAFDPVDKDGDTLLESDSLRVSQPRRLPHAICPNHGGRFKSAYGHHVKNVAGGQWRKELREMIAFADRHMEKLRRKSFGMGVVQESLWVDRERLKDLVRGRVPYEYVFKVEEGVIRLGDVGDPFAGVDGFEEGENGDTGGEGGAVEDHDAFGLPLEGSDAGTTVADTEEDSDVNSLFGDSEAEEPVVQTDRPVPSSHLPLADTQASSNKYPEKTVSGDQSGSKMLVPAGPSGTMVDSTSENEGNEADGLAASTASAPSLPPRRPTPATYQEGAVRPTSSTIAENYSDEEAVDAVEKPAVTEGVATSSKESGTGTSAGKQVESGANTTPQAATDTPGGEDAQASTESDNETMTFMEWLTQKSRANALASAATAATSGAAGEKPGTTSTAGKPVAGDPSAVEETPSTVKPQGKASPASAASGPPTTAKPEGVTLPASAQPHPPKTDPKRKSPPTTAPAPPSKKPKPDPRPGASSAGKLPPSEEPSTETSAASTSPLIGIKRKHPGDAAISGKKAKTRGEAGVGGTDRQDEATGRKERKGQVEYVSEPREEGDAGGESNDGGRRKKEGGRKKDERQGNSGGALAASAAPTSATASTPATTPATTTAPATAPSAPPTTSSNAPQIIPAPHSAPQPTFSIPVPPKADGSGPDYNRITVKNLRVLAKERGVSLRGASLKAQIVRRFEEHDEENGDG